MAFLYTLVIACFAAAASAQSNAVIEQVPSLVQLENWLPTNDWVQHCNGAILNNRNVLSSASCYSVADYHPEFLRIRAGSSIRNTGGSIYYVERGYLYGGYPNTPNHGDDIVVIALETSFRYGATVQPGVFAAEGSIIPAGISLLNAGWGQGDNNDLRQTRAQTVNSNFCSDQTRAEQKSLCISGLGADEFDYGSPLYFSSSNQKIIVGLIAGPGPAPELVPPFPDRSINNEDIEGSGGSEESESDESESESDESEEDVYQVAAAISGYIEWIRRTAA